MASIPFRGAATAAEARSITRTTLRPRFYLPLLVWVGLLFILLGGLTFDLRTLNGMGWLLAGLATIVVTVVLGWGNRRRFARTAASDVISGFVSPEKLRIESDDGAIELPLSKLAIAAHDQDFVIVRLIGGRRFWIFKSAFASPEQWREARSLIDAATGSRK